MRSPKLRFGEFKQDWAFHKFSDITEILRCGIASTPIYVDEGVPFLSAQNVTSDGQVSLHKYSLISEEFYKKISKNNELKKGDLLYSRVGAGYGKAALFNLDGDYGVYVSLTHIRPTNTVDPEYLKQYLNSPYGNTQAKNGVVQGGGVPNLNVKTVEKFLIPLPSLKEQEKIGGGLKFLDQKIALLNDECKCLVKYKKGVMQKIFSQEIRFKDDAGNNYPEWEEKTLAEVSKKKSSPISANKIENNFGEYKIYGASGVLKNIDFFTEEKPYVSVVKDGAGVGRAFLCDGKTSVLGTMEMVLPSECIDVKYLYEVINRINFREYITGSTIPHVYYKDYSLEIVPLPSLEEQKKIASFLSAIDEKISITQNQLDLTKQYKQGLLQQMFV